ncbi:Alpha-monoglucosyldiacylglycerol synthase [Marinomonas spartinae]|uniref:Alpha-monoglucosyldiacylglycerol synthase n=1 Tax=Marinomonas spartinae TaxID=1792290 RepID=A0A1A8T7A0_9GAMM|nr:glycosyltransferase [Marinomonas spartinae]SBS27010.1 Alpha-monoglucosyldiacylglycerol synthase [Marinomonas spartinae]
MICFLVPSLKDSSPIRAAIDLALNVKESKVLVFVLDDFSIDDLNYIKINKAGINVFSAHWQGWSDIFRVLNKINEVLKYDNGVIVSFLFRADVVLSLLKTHFKKVSSLRNSFWEEYVSDYGLIKGKMYSFFHLKALKEMDKVVVMTPEVVSSMRKFGVKKHCLVQIENYLDIDRLNLIKDVTVDFGFDNVNPVFVSVSSFTPRKRIPELVESFFKYLESGGQANLALLGEGPDFQKVKNIVDSKKNLSSSVKFLGQVKDAVPYIKAADVFVLSSSSEGISRAFMEALYFHKKCLVSRISSNEYIGRGEGVFFFDDFDGLCDGFSLVLNYDGLPSKLTDCFLPCTGRKRYIDTFLSLNKN